MSDKPNWLKAKRTVGGEEVINLRLAKGHGDWYYGKPHFAGEIRRNGFLYSCAWSIESGRPVEQFSNYPAQALDPASTTEPEALTPRERQVERLEKHGLVSAADANTLNAECTCPWVVGKKYPCEKCQVRAPAKPGVSPAKATQAAMVEYLLKRDAAIFEGLKESEMRDANQAALDGETRPVDAETAARGFAAKHPAVAVAEWKPGDKCECGGETHVVLGIDGGSAWVRSLEDGTYQTVAVWALKAPAPRTRDVVRTVWLQTDANGNEYIAEEYEGFGRCLASATVTFPGVAVEVDDE